MKEFKVLKILDFFRGFFERLGVDYFVMRRILQVKLTMDGRRVPTIMNNYKQRKDFNKDANNFIRSLWIYAILGAVLAIFVVMGDNYIYQMSITFGMMMFMIMSVLISDFSVVLLDVRDKDILFTKPVSNITINMAKTIHILIYMFFLTISMTGIPLLVSLVIHGFVFFIVFAIEIILADLFIVVVAALLYLLILRFFDGEKLKDIINYFQIALTVGITVGYQLISRLFDFTDFSATFHIKWWQYLIIPIWFGGPFEVIVNQSTQIHYIIFSVLTIIVPIISIFVYIKLIPSFEKNLQKLNNNGEVIQKKKVKEKKNFGTIICSNKEERIFYKFAINMFKKEREFKLKVYPSVGLALVFPFIFIISLLKIGNFQGAFTSRSYFYLYFSSLLIPTVVMMMKYSGAYKAAWIYKVLPIDNYTSIFKGTMKAILMHFILPIFVLQSGVFLFIFGVKIWIDLIIVLLNLMMFLPLSFSFMKKGLPFSEHFGIANQSDGVLVILLFLLFVVVAAIHFACSFFTVAEFVLLGILLLANFICWKFGFANVKLVD